MKIKNDRISRLSMEDEINLGKRLDHLRQQHRHLDQTIDQLARGSFHDQLQLGRLKKERLNLREQIVQIESMLYPDIIA